MKKYISWVVCAVLLFSAMLLPKFNPIEIGKGSGVGQKVESVEEVADILCSFGATEDELNQMMSTNTVEQTNTHKSVTLEFEINRSFSMWQKSTRKQFLSSQSRMTMYIDDEKVYYRAESDTFQEAPLGEEMKRVSSSPVFDLYVFGEQVFLKVMQGAGEGFPKELLNKWVDMGDGAEMFQAVTGMNLLIMSTIGQYILNCEEDIFSRSGNTYTLNSTAAKTLWGQLSFGEIKEDEFDEAEFFVDLSSKRSPFFSARCTVTEKGEGSSFWWGEHVKCRLSNIDNTKVNFPQNVEIYNLFDYL